MLSSFLISQVVGAKLLNITDVTGKLVLVFSHNHVYLELDRYFFLFFNNKLSPIFLLFSFITAPFLFLYF